MAKNLSRLSVEKLIALYEAQPAKLRRWIAGMSKAQLRARPGPSAKAGSWSTLELICHLSDSEQVYADRIKRTIAMDHPLILFFDQDQYASRLAYPQRDVEEELRLIELTRDQIVRILRQLPAAAWQRQAVHNVAGLRTLRDWVETRIAHINHHGAFIPRKRRAIA